MITAEISAELTVGVYGLVGLLLGALEVAGRLRPDRFSTLSRVITWAMRRRSAQLGLLLTWWWLGWHFVTAR